METMQRLQAYKYELMPTGNQQRDMRRFAGACRFVYNKATHWELLSDADFPVVLFPARSTRVNTRG